MDLETENRIASILMKEAAELRHQAEKEGVHAYLREPNVRFRPNSRFLTATVLGVQQANRVAEVNEMWRVRKKEREVNDELPAPTREKKKYHDSPRSTSSGDREHTGSLGSTGTMYREQNSHIPSSSKADFDDSCSKRDSGWKDEEIEQFLHSRVKRGRGGVGARMDEPGPYLPPDSRTKLSESLDIREKEEWEGRVLGPEKPLSLRSNRSSEDDDNRGNWKRAKRVEMESPKKHSKKHKRREEKHADKERKVRKSKHKHKKRH